MKKICRMLCMSICMAMLCCACGSSAGRLEEGSGSTEQPEVHPSSSAGNHTITDTPYIGIVLKATDNPYFALLKAGAEHEADLLGVQVMVVSPNHESNVQQQTDLVSTMADMAVDVIAVAPSNEEDLTEALDRAADNGKLILSVDTALEYEGCACYIGTDQYNAGYQQGQYAAKLVEQNDIASAVVLRGPTEDKAHTLREYGIVDALEDGGVTIVRIEDCGCDEETAEQAMTALLEEHPEINVVCTTSDSMAVGAQRAIVNAEKKDVHIIAFDGMQEASELVRIGEMDAVFAQKPYEMGRLCVDAAVKLYQGEEMDASVHTDVELITQGNAQAHIDEINRQLNQRGIK